MSRLADHLREFEGLRLVAYQDVAGVWTIGYGHTGPDVRKGLTITRDRAEDLLYRDLAWVRAEIEESVKVPLKAHQEDALSSLIFNIGASAWRKSTVLRRLNAGDYAGAAEAIAMWNKARVNGKLTVVPGLVRRREAERTMFVGDLPDDGEPMPQAVEGGEAKPMTKSNTIWASLAASGGLIATVIETIGQMDWRVAVPLIVVGGALGYIVVNRVLESRRGEH